MFRICSLDLRNEVRNSRLEWLSLCVRVSMRWCDRLSKLCPDDIRPRRSRSEWGLRLYKWNPHLFLISFELPMPNYRVLVSGMLGCWRKWQNRYHWRYLTKVAFCHLHPSDRLTRAFLFYREGASTPGVKDPDFDFEVRALYLYRVSGRRASSNSQSEVHD